MPLIEPPKHERHEPQNANEVSKSKMRFQDRLALRITLLVGTMTTAGIFALISLFALPDAIKSHNIIIIVAWVSQAFLQLVLLPIIIVGQNLQGQHTEVRAEEEFETTTTSYHDLEHILKHLDAQDEELLKQSKLIEEILKKIEKK